MPIHDPWFVIRFWAWVRRAADDACWEWQGSIGSNGYGRLRHQGKTWLAHRIAYRLANGPIPAGMFVCHACDNRVCVRASHLCLGTHEDNIGDMVAKGRHRQDRSRVRMPRGDEHWSRRRSDLVARGAMQPGSKLSDETVREARLARQQGASYPTLARRYGVSTATIRSAVVGLTWKHVE
jgi:hypothetical protein